MKHIINYMKKELSNRQARKNMIIMVVLMLIILLEQNRNVSYVGFLVFLLSYVDAICFKDKDVIILLDIGICIMLLPLLRMATEFNINHGLSLANYFGFVIMMLVFIIATICLIVYCTSDRFRMKKYACNIPLFLYTIGFTIDFLYMIVLDCF